jgi:hypothetical protein
MNLRTSNYLNMIKTCLDTANDEEHQPTWSGQPPTDFTTDIYDLGLKYNGAMAKAALAEGTPGGGDQKALAETALENAAYVLARALSNHYKKTGNLDDRSKVNMTKSAIVRLRHNNLISKATQIRDLATAATSDPTAAGRGVTAARISTLSDAIVAFSAVQSLPRDQTVNRGTILRDLDTDVAEMVASLEDMDELVDQFDTTEEGLQFIEAWRRARIIVDLTAGGGGETPTPPTPPGP